MKIIHVNINVIRRNKKNGENFPAVRIQEGTDIKYCREVKINGPSKMVYRPEKPLPCGAKVWIETEAELEIM